uniref:Uncharacterized protein n=1 Tax=Octopus bimaculoides TaxID=37653 RepID=A0A0L8FK26_OCTBM
MLQSILQLIQNIPSSSPISETRNLLDTIPFPCESQEDVEALEAELSDGVVQNNMLSYTFYKFMVLLAGSLITSLPLSN